MKDFKFPAVFLFAFMFESSFAEKIPGDSVINPAQRGRSGILIDMSSAGALSLLHSTWLASQTNENVFVDYGPFTNESAATMVVSLVSKGMSGRRTLVGGYEGGVRHESSDSITFEVPPLTVFGFSVKDYAELSVSIKHGNISGRPTGVPSESDFLVPTGRYLRCIGYGEPQTDETGVISATYYLYEAGSMSDKSTRRDYINKMDSRVTSGIRPAAPGTCTAG